MCLNFNLFFLKKQDSQFLTVKRVKVKVDQSCPTLLNPVAYTVHGILQARILEWVAFQGIFPTQGSNQGLLHCRQILYQLSYQGSPCWQAKNLLKNRRKIYMKRAPSGHMLPFSSRYIYGRCGMNEYCSLLVGYLIYIVYQCCSYCIK